MNFFSFITLFAVLLPSPSLFVTTAYAEDEVQTVSAPESPAEVPAPTVPEDASSDVVAPDTDATPTDILMSVDDSATPPAPDPTEVVAPDPAPVVPEQDPQGSGEVLGETALPQSVVSRVVEVDDDDQCEDVSNTYVSDNSTQVDAHDSVPVSPINGGWTANIPGATWIWSENPLSNSVVDTTDTFTKTFTITGTPQDSTLDIAADNSYTISVNEFTDVFSDATEFNYSSEGQDSYTIPAANLHAGSNTITFVVKNWGIPSTPETNPAGLLYKLTINEKHCPTQNFCDPEVNLIQNGSFENPAVTDASGWDIFDTGTSGLGWTAEWMAPALTFFNFVQIPFTPSMELQKNGLVANWSASDGNQWTELDGDWNGHSGDLNGEPASTKIYQDVATVPGNKYKLTFDWSPRPGSAAAENNLEVRWDGSFLASFGPTAGGAGTAWVGNQYTGLEVSGTTTRLQFADLGTSNSEGTLLDNVRLTCIPEDPNAPTITVTKVVNGNDPVSAFPLFVNEDSVISGVANTYAPGTYTIHETSLPGYNASFSGACVEDPDNATRNAKIQDWRTKKEALQDVIDSNPGSPDNAARLNHIADIDAKIAALQGALSATLTLGEEDATCTITNTFEPPVEYGPYCGDGMKNQEWEQCDGEIGCSDQCQIGNQCTNKVFARVVTPNVNSIKNWGDGNMTSDVYVGGSSNADKIPSNTWFLMNDGTNWMNDADILAYESVPGFAVQRMNTPSIRLLVEGSHGTVDDDDESNGKEHADGYIEVSNATVVSQSNDLSGNNKVEKPATDNYFTGYKAGDDSYEVSGGLSKFWLNVTGADDAFYTNLSAPIVAQCGPMICDPKVNLIENGSFEQPEVTYGDHWQAFEGGNANPLTWIVEWVNSLGAPAIPTLELQEGIAAGGIWNADDGNQWAELDSDWNNVGNQDPADEHAQTSISQTIATVPGWKYKLSYSFSPNPSITDASQNALSAKWNGTVVDTSGPTAGNTTSTVWQHKVVTNLIGTGSDEVRLTDTGSMNDTFGTFLDNVSLTCEPVEDIPDDGGYCGDGIINQDWEQCDGGESCTAQCQATDQCTEKAFAKVTVTSFVNGGVGPDAGDMSSDIYLGGADVSNKIPSGTWFMIYDGTNYVTDPTMDAVPASSSWSNVPGLAIERQAGIVRANMYGYHPNYSVNTEKAKGTIEYFNTVPNPIGAFPDFGSSSSTQDSDPFPDPLAADSWHLERWNDGLPGAVTTSNDEIYTTGNVQHFEIGVGQAADAFKNYYKTDMIDALDCEEGTDGQGSSGGDAGEVTGGDGSGIGSSTSGSSGASGTTGGGSTGGSTGDANRSGGGSGGVALISNGGTGTGDGVVLGSNTAEPEVLGETLAQTGTPISLTMMLCLILIVLTFVSARKEKFS